MKFERRVSLDFTGGPGVKNLPDNAGDMSSVPGPGGFHMRTGQLSPCTTTTASIHALGATGPQLLGLCALESRLCNRRATVLKLHTLLERSPC